MPCCGGSRGWTRSRPAWRRWHSAWSTRCSKATTRLLLLPFTPSATPARGPMAIRNWSGGWTRRSPSRTGDLSARRRGPPWPRERRPTPSCACSTARCGGEELRRLLEIDETQVSRTGRRLLESGLVTRRRVGRQVFWRLTPRGQRALEEAPAPQRSPNSEFWQEALRRGFEAAYGDEPGEPREVDPTRERIIECSLELHTSRGIQATTWAQIADNAGVPVETVKALFPTQDDLVRSCGEHLLESLQLPPADRAPEVFAGASSENERIRRLVETFFGIYERGGDGIAVGRR